MNGSSRIGQVVQPAVGSESGQLFMQSHLFRSLRRIGAACSMITQFGSSEAQVAKAVPSLAVE